MWKSFVLELHGEWSEFAVHWPEVHWPEVNS
jgi:hypothetical protein